MVSRPIMDVHTYSSRQSTGTQSWSDVPGKRVKLNCFFFLAQKHEFLVQTRSNAPSLIHLVNVPETNMQMAMPMPEHMTSGRRLKRFKNHAFDRDMKKRVMPTKMDTWNGFTLVPTSCKTIQYCDIFSIFAAKYAISSTIPSAGNVFLGKHCFCCEPAWMWPHRKAWCRCRWTAGSRTGKTKWSLACSRWGGRNRPIWRLGNPRAASAQTKSSKSCAYCCGIVTLVHVASYSDACRPTFESEKKKKISISLARHTWSNVIFGVERGKVNAVPCALAVDNSCTYISANVPLLRCYLWRPAKPVTRAQRYGWIWPAQLCKWLPARRPCATPWMCPLRRQPPYLPAHQGRNGQN